LPFDGTLAAALPTVVVVIDVIVTVAAASALVVVVVFVVVSVAIPSRTVVLIATRSSTAGIVVVVIAATRTIVLVPSVARFRSGRRRFAFLRSSRLKNVPARRALHAAPWRILRKAKLALALGTRNGRHPTASNDCECVRTK
jgi:hypothetical protein